MDNLVKLSVMEKAVKRRLVCYVNLLEPAVAELRAGTHRAGIEWLGVRKTTMSQTGELKADIVIIAEIIDSYNIISPLCQLVHQMCAYKSGSTGNKYLHKLAEVW